MITFNGIIICRCGAEISTSEMNTMRAFLKAMHLEEGTFCINGMNVTLNRKDF